VDEVETTAELGMVTRAVAQRLGGEMSIDQSPLETRACAADDDPVQQVLDEMRSALDDSRDVAKQITDALDTAADGAHEAAAVADAMALVVDEPIAVVDADLGVRFATVAARRLLGFEGAAAATTADPPASLRDVLPTPVTATVRRWLARSGDDHDGPGAEGTYDTDADDGSPDGPAASLTVSSGALQLTVRRTSSQPPLKLRPRGGRRPWTAAVAPVPFGVVRIAVADDAPS
jgi:hypothetical protein